MFYHCNLEIVHLGFMTEAFVQIVSIYAKSNFYIPPLLSTPLALTLHDPVLRGKVVDIVLEIFVSRGLLEGEGLGLDEAVQEVALLTVLGVLCLRLPILAPVEAAQAPGLPLPLDGELPFDGELGRVSLILLCPGHWGLGTYRCGTGGIS